MMSSEQYTREKVRTEILTQLTLHLIEMRNDAETEQQSARLRGGVTSLEVLADRLGLDTSEIRRQASVAADLAITIHGPLAYAATRRRLDFAEPVKFASELVAGDTVEVGGDTAEVLSISSHGSGPLSVTVRVRKADRSIDSYMVRRDEPFPDFSR